MPPVLAFTACAIFISLLFFFERKHYGTARFSTWTPLLFILILASRPLILWLNPGAATEPNETPGSPYDLFFYVCLILAGTFILSKRISTLFPLLKSNIWIVMIFAFCGLSILWSDAPRASFNAWVKVMVLFLMVTVILTEPDPLGSLCRVFRRASFVLIPLSIVLIKYFPAYGRSYSPWSGAAFYGGVTTYKNGLGFLCLVFGVFILWDTIRYLRSAPSGCAKTPLLINFGLLGMVAWLLYMANSATATATTIAGAVLLIVMELPFIKRWIKSIDILLFTMLFIALIMFFMFNALESIVTGLGRDMTLTGRTIIWERVLSMDSNPLVGTGYASFWLGERGEFLLDLNWQQLTQSHNGFIEVYLNLGLIGLALLIMMIIRTYRNAKINFTADYQYGKLQFVSLVVILLTNITEASYAINSLPWFLCVLTAFNIFVQTDLEASANPLHTS